MSDLDRLQHPRARKLFVMWNDWRGARTMPTRNELDLGALKPVLPYMLILERSPVSPRYIFRLAGTALREVTGIELTGRDLLDLWPAGMERIYMEQALDKVVGAQIASVFRLRGETGNGHYLALEMLCLPVRVDNRRTVNVLGALLPFSAPFWLGDPMIRRYRLIERTALCTAAAPDADETVPAPGIVSPQAAPGFKLRAVRSGSVPPGRAG